jgi:uncharacterized membrane protein
VVNNLKRLYAHFWVFGIFGSALEAVWYFYLTQVRHELDTFPEYYTLTPIRVSYGIGAVVLILTAIPLMQKMRPGPKRLLSVFALGVVLCSSVELVSSLMLVLRMGHNPLWDYSAKPFNFYGHICLENAILFGIISVIYAYAIYPRIERVFTRMKQAQGGKIFDIFFWVTFTTYVLDLGILAVRTVIALVG